MAGGGGEAVCVKKRVALKNDKFDFFIYVIYKGRSQLLTGKLYTIYFCLDESNADGSEYEIRRVYFYGSFKMCIQNLSCVPFFDFEN